MKLKLRFGIVLLILLSSCSALTSAKKIVANASEQTEVKRGQILPITAMAQIGEKTIQLEVAETPQQQATGLMFRESLADDRGMLFPFGSERKARFWMKNVPISLDIIFLKGDRIVGMAVNVPGCSTEPCPVYGPEALVDKVLELRGGRAEELGIKIDDNISIMQLNHQQIEDNQDN